MLRFYNTFSINDIIIMTLIKERLSKNGDACYLTVTSIELKNPTTMVLENSETQFLNPLTNI